MSGKEGYAAEAIDGDADSRGAMDYGALDLGAPVRRRDGVDVYEATATVDGADRTVAVRRPRLQGTLARRTESYLEAVRDWASVDDHEGVQRLYDWGATDDGPWVAAEPLDGTLRDRIDEGIDAEAAIRLAERTARALQHVHEGLVHHLALTPERVAFRPDDGDRPVIAGLAASVLDDGRDHGALSPAYAAPEQFAPGESFGPDQRTDVYRLGAILYELLTGSHPYGERGAALVERVVDADDQPAPPSDHADGLPEGTDEVLATALATDPGDRYWTADEFGRALAELLGEGDRYRSGLESWTQDGAEPRHTHRVIDDGPEGRVDVEWELDEAMGGGKNAKTFTVGDGKVFLGVDGEADGHNDLAGVDDDTGEIVWRSQVGQLVELRRKPAVADGALLVPIQNALRAYDTDSGEVLWETEAGSAVESSVTVADGTAYVGTAGGTAVAFDVESGDRTWSFDAEGAVEATPTVDGDAVYVRDAADVVYALDADDGSERWRDEETLVEFDDFEYVPPVAAHGRVYVAHENRIYAFDAEDGELRWEFFPGANDIDGFFQTPAVGGGKLFAATEGSDFWALDAETGQEEWRFEGTADMTAAAVTGGTVYFGDEEDLSNDSGYIRAVDADTGEEVWVTDTGVHACDIVVADGNVYSFDGQSGDPMRKFSAE